MPTIFGVDVPETNSERNESGAFLGRLQHNAKSGTWLYVKRVQQSDGGWDDEESMPFNTPSFLADFHSFEFGWIKFSRGAPDFRLVPYGTPLPPKPEDEKGADSRFKLGFRMKVTNQKLFQDTDAYYFSNNADSVTKPMSALLSQVMAAAEFAEGKCPFVVVTGRTKIESRAQGGSPNFGPTFEIKGWYNRPACFGERTVAADNGALNARQVGSATNSQQTGNAVNNTLAQTTVARHHPPARESDPMLNDSIPF